MSTHPIDRLLAHAGSSLTRARVCHHNHERDQARAALVRAEALLRLAHQARIVEAVAQFASAASSSLPGQMRRGTIAA